MSDPDLSPPGAPPHRALERDAHAEGWAASKLHIAQNGLGPAPRRPAPEVSLVCFEINEAERHFLEKFIQAGKLPTLARMPAEGGHVRWPAVLGSLLSYPPRNHGHAVFYIRENWPTTPSASRRRLARCRSFAWPRAARAPTAGSSLH
jgi:hypothetical protein